MNEESTIEESSSIGCERFVIFGGLMLGILLGSIDESTVSTLPTGVSDLGGEYYISWVVTSSLVTIPATTPLYGNLSDICGGHGTGTSITIFLLRSAFSGLSGDLGLNGFVSPMV